MKTIINEKSAKTFTKIVRQRKRYYWNLYNPKTGCLLKSNDLKIMGIEFFKNRPDCDDYGVIDVSGVDWEHNLLWLKRVENFFKEGYYLCTGSDIMICDCVNCGYNDDNGKVIPFSD